MLQLIPEISRDLQAGRPPKAESIGRIQQLNGPLLTTALKLPDDVPGTGVNGKFSDPAFMLNALATTLATADVPLTETQGKALEDLARSWMARDRQRRQGYDDTTWTIQKLYEEAEIKDGFFREAFALLTAAQLEIVRPPEIVDRIRMDLFSSGLLYVMRVRPVLFETREELVQEIEQGASLVFRFTDEERERVRPVVAAWIDEVSPRLLEHVADVLDREGIIDARLATAWAKEQLVLIRRVAATLGFDEGRLQTARDYGSILVPMRRS